jgi:Na+/phosphate symporter
VIYAFPYFGEVRTLALFYVMFRTLVALLVFPFLTLFSTLFQKYITDKANAFSFAVQKIDKPVDMEVAILAIKQDLLVYFKEVISYNLNIWDFYLTDVTEEVDVKKLLLRNLNFGNSHFRREYQEIKTIQETLLSFLVTLNQGTEQNPEEAEQLASLYQVVIEIGDSSKYLKDVWERVEDWQWSTSPELQKDYEVLRKIVLDFYQKVMQVLTNLDNKKSITMLHELLEQIQKNDKKYIRMYEREGNDLKLANLIQVNRYFSLSCMSLVRAMEGVSLTVEEKKYLKENIKELF